MADARLGVCALAEELLLQEDQAAGVHAEIGRVEDSTRLKHGGVSGRGYEIKRSRAVGPLFD
ncbi:hypothetical protein GCM10017744_006940 [Streptomyces antimycoticus]